jgi:hypothetical protein
MVARPAAAPGREDRAARKFTFCLSEEMFWRRAFFLILGLSVKHT